VSAPFASGPPMPHGRAAVGSPWWIRTASIAALLVAAYFTGVLLMHPQRRVIEAVAGALLIYLAFHFSIYQSLAFLLVVYPYPTHTTGGSTNTLILLVIAVVWAARVTAGELKVSFRSLLTPYLPVIALGYLLSTYSIHTPEEFTGGMAVLTDVLSCICLYFMVVNFVTDERALRRTLVFLGISSILIHAVAVYEVVFPGRAFLPGWLLSPIEKIAGHRGYVRTGGPFRDFELLSEYCAVIMPIVLFLWVRSQPGRRLFWTVVLALTLFSLYATVTRGGFISVSIGLAYLAWLLHKELGLAKTVATVVVGAGLLLGAGAALPAFLGTMSMFSRLEETKIVHGVPDSRVAAWGPALQRALEKPILGHGPLYTFGSGLTKYPWPHNGYLFLWVTIGITGLLGYVLAFLTCFFATGRYRGAYTSGPFAPGLLTALHVSWLVLIVDQLKIDFERNQIYFLFVWLLMGLTAAPLPAPAPPRRAIPAPAGAAATGRIRKIMDP